MGIGMEFDLGVRNENKSRDTGRAEPGQGQSGGPLSSPHRLSPQPLGPARLADWGRGEGGSRARAVPRRTHLIRRSWAHSRLDCASAPGSAAPSAVGTAVAPPPPEPGGVCRLRSGRLPGAPPGQRAERSEQGCECAASAQQQAARSSSAPPAAVFA